jgi:hypothetical protein
MTAQVSLHSGLILLYLISTTTDFWFTTDFILKVKAKVKVTLRLMISQSVSLGVEPHLGLMTRYLLLFDSYGLVIVGRPFWREDESVFCICCWPLPAQSFSGPSPLGVAAIFYCLRFETSIFVASYDSQGHGGGIRPRLHTEGMTSFWVWVWVLCYDRRSAGQSVLE